MTTMKYLVTAFLIAAVSANGQTFKTNVSKKGTTAASFLSISQGARAMAMGSAFVAVVDDPSALYYNPAGITDIYGGSALVENTQWLAETQYNFVAGTFTVDGFGSLGISFTSSSIDEMKVTTVDNPDGNGEMFGVSDVAFGVTYALKLTDKFSIGFNPKYIYQKIWKMSASAVAIDVGVKYITPFDGIVLGMSISNFGTKMQMSGNNANVLYDPDQSSLGNNDRIPASLSMGQWALPLNFKVGLAYKVFNSDMHSLLVAVDASHPSDDYESVDIGGEYVFNNFLAFRGGYQSLFLNEAEEGMTLGIGVKQNITGTVQFSFDYAYQDFGRLKNVQKFAVGILF
jgi:hypothetical protein